MSTKDRNEINAANLEGKCIRISDPTPDFAGDLLCTGGFGCSPVTNGKIFVTSVNSGAKSHVHRADVIEITDTVVTMKDLPATFEHWTSNDEKPGQIGLGFSNGEIIWMRTSDLGNLGLSIINRALWKE